MLVEHNLFLAPQRALVVRGEPEQSARFERNWCVQDSARGAVAGESRTRLGSNAYGRAQPRLIEGG